MEIVKDTHGELKLKFAVPFEDRHAFREIANKEPAIADPAIQMFVLYGDMEGFYSVHYSRVSEAKKIALKEAYRRSETIYLASR